MKKLMLIAAVFLAGWLRAHPITVDGDPSDWIGIPADTAVIDSGEWIATDLTGDDLGDNGDAPNAPDNPGAYQYPSGIPTGTGDITEVRITLDTPIEDTLPTYFYGLVRVDSLNQNTIVTILVDVDTLIGSNMTPDGSDIVTERAWDLSILLYNGEFHMYDFTGNPLNLPHQVAFNYTEGVIEFGFSVEQLPEPSGMYIWTAVYSGTTFNGQYTEVDSLPSSVSGGGGMVGEYDPDAYDVLAPSLDSQTAFLSSYTSTTPAVLPSALFYPIPLTGIMDFVPLSIEEIQGHSSSSPFVGLKVLTWGVVSGVYSRGFFLQDLDSLGRPYPWSGIYVYTNTTPSVSRGEAISIVAEVAEFHGLTELKNIDTLIVVDTVDNIQPVYVPTGSVSDEQWEGVLVMVDSAVCTNPDLGYGEWEVNDGSGPVRIDDLGYSYTPDSGHVYRIVGPVYYSYGNFKIEPRDSADVLDYTQVPPPQVPDIVINEVYYDSPGSDHGTFTEIAGNPGTSLDNVHLIGINGSNDQIYADIDLSGFQIPISGFFVVAQDTSVPNANYINPDVNWQNGPDNVLLVYISGSDTILIDAVGYGPEDTTSWHFRGEFLPTVDARSGYSIGRIPDRMDTDSNVVDFTQVAPTPGMLNGDLLFTDGFESGSGNWSGDWGISQVTSHLGNYSFTESPTGNYPNNANLIATLNQPIMLGPYFGAYLQFYHAYWIENGFDFGHIEVSIDGGNTWTEVATYTGTQSQWTFESIDLSAFCGLNDVRIRFRLTSDGAVTEDGWYIDDVKIVGSTVDVSAPLIVHNPPADTVSILDTMLVQVNYFDPSGIFADTMFYSIDGASYFALSDSATGNTYYYTITGLTPGAFLEYWFKAVDSHGNGRISPHYYHIAGRVLYRDDADPGYITLPSAGDSLAVRFDNVPADSIWVTTLLYNFYTDPNHALDTVTVHVWDSNAVDLIPPRQIYPVNTPDNPHTWTAVDIRNENLFVPGGMPFYVGVEYRDTIPALLLDSPGSFNSSYRYAGGEFHLLGVDLFIRSIVGVYGTGVSESPISYPFRLMQNSPNPVKDRTRITFSIPSAGHVELVLYDLSGRRVKTLFNGNLERGLHSIDVSVSGLRSGIYFYMLRAGEMVKMRKMMILR